MPFLPFGRSFVVGVMAIVTLLALSFSLAGENAELTMLAFLAIVFVVAWAADVWAGVSVAVVGAAGLHYLAWGTGALGLGERLALVFAFLIVGAGMSFAAARVRASRRDLRLSQERYQSLVEGLPVMIYIDEPDRDATNIYTSPQSEAICGYSAADWRADPALFPKLLHPDDRERVDEEHDRFYATNEPLSTLYRIIAKDGRLVWIQDEAVLIRDDAGEPLYVQGYWQDVSDRKRLEEQLLQVQKMEVVGQLAGGIAHDFNNLLTVISGAAELARLEDLPPVSAEYVQEIQAAAERASKLTHHLLAFSRQQLLCPEVLDLRDVLASLDNLLRHLVGAGVEMVVRAPKELSAVKADRGQMEQVIVNLAVNAKDALEGRGRLSFELAEVSGEHGPEVVLRVEDDGVGMPAHVREKVFEPFFTTKEVGKGTGLGLSTVYGTVQQSGGRVEVASEPGRGTTFTVYLPAVAGAPLKPDSSRERARTDA